MMQEVSIRNKSRSISRRTFLTLASVGATAMFFIPKENQAYASEAKKKSCVVDSIGRAMLLESEVECVFPSGPYAQMMMETLCPRSLGAIALPITTTDKNDYVAAGLRSLTRLPSSTQIMDSLKASTSSSLSRSLNKTSSLILDVGFPSDGLQDRLSALETKTGLPCFFVDISFGLLADAYRVLGDILGCRERAESLASFVEDSLNLAKSVSGSSGETCRVFYAPRKHGTMLKGDIRVQIDLISFLGGTPIVSPYHFDSSTVNLEDPLIESADVIIFDDANTLSAFRKKCGEAYDIWKEIPAIQRNSFVVSPALFHSWFGSAIFSQSIGALWAAYNLWPENQNFDIRAKALTFYNLFYGLPEGEVDVDQLLGEYCREGEF